MKRLKKRSKKVILRLFAFVSIFSVALCGFTIGGNAVSFEAPSVNVTSTVSTFKAQYQYVEFRNTSVRYNSYSGYYNTVLVLLPRTRSGIFFYMNDSGSDSAKPNLVYAGFSSEFTNGLDDSIFYVAYANNLLPSSVNLTGSSGIIRYSFATICLYYANDTYYCNQSINNYLPANIDNSITQSINYSFERSEYNNYINGRITAFHNSNIFPANFSGTGLAGMYNQPQLNYISPVGANVNAVNTSGDTFNFSRLTFMLGETWNYVWSGATIEYELSQDGNNEPLIIDFSHSGCSDGSQNVCDCDCGYYTEQLKEDLIDYFDTNYITKDMFLQYASGVSQLASSYSSLASSYSVQANNYSSLASGYSALARSYSELATELSGNLSLQEAQNSLISEQNSIDNSRASASESSRNAEQSELNSIANGTTSPDSDISGGVAELSSKFDIYFNQIESFQSNLQTVPAEVSQAGAMVTSITQKLPSSIIVAITFMLIVFVVVKVLGR